MCTLDLSPRILFCETDDLIATQIYVEHYEGKDLGFSKLLKSLSLKWQKVQN